MNMSKRIIYMRTSDIILRHYLDEIVKLEKGCYNINDLLAIKKLLDTLEEQILEEISNNSTDHTALVEELQNLTYSDLSTEEEQVDYIDSEYQLTIPDYVNDLENEILNMNAPFTNTQYNKLVELEKKLVKDINKIVNNNNQIAEKVNSIKESIEIAEDNTQELIEEVEAIQASEKLNLNINSKLISKYEGQIKGILGNTSVETVIEQNTSNWLSEYTISYGTAGDELYALIVLTNEINNLYASLNDTTNYEAIQLFASTVLNTIQNINEITPEDRQTTLENAIDEAIINEPETIQDIVRGFKASLARFSSDNYQFNQEDITALENAVNNATSEINRMNTENEEIQSQIVAKTNELAQAKEEYQEKHDELPDIADIDTNQDPKTNTEGIENIINEINDIIDSELPYINDFEVEYNNEEMNANEERTITITSIEPTYHKETSFEYIVNENDDTFEIINFNNQSGEITIKATGTGNITFIIKNGEVEKQINIPVSIVTPESFVWYIGKNENNILGETENNGVYSYNFDVASLPTVSNINEIYTNEQSLDSSNKEVFVVCPALWINEGWNNNVWTAKFKLIDLNDLNIVLTDVTTNDSVFVDNNLVLLMGTNTITDTTIKVRYNENDSTLI